jgi:hypothetical protein
LSDLEAEGWSRVDGKTRLEPEGFELLTRPQKYYHVVSPRKEKGGASNGGLVTFCISLFLSGTLNHRDGRIRSTKAAGAGASYAMDSKCSSVASMSADRFGFG